MYYLPYTGIGSRTAPQEVINCFYELGSYLADNGFTLRSGHADGCDDAFERGCNFNYGHKEIYLPWRGFNGSNSDLYDISSSAYELAERYHPAWERTSNGTKKLLARDGYQVLGKTLDNPTRFIICYTDGGKIKGGTGQALRIAQDYNIKVFNAGSYNNLEQFKKDVLDYADNITKPLYGRGLTQPIIFYIDN